MNIYHIFDISSGIRCKCSHKVSETEESILIQNFNSVEKALVMGTNPVYVNQVADLNENEEGDFELAMRFFKA